MTEKKVNEIKKRKPDCVTETRMGNSVLVVSGYFKKDTSATAADKMMKVIESEEMKKSVRSA
jgi:hypothetical protein